MYSRRLYRKPPPGYSGVAFSQKSDGQNGRISEEDLALSGEQRIRHTEEKRRMAPLGKSYEGQNLTPLTRGESESFVFCGVTEPTDKKDASTSDAPLAPENDGLILIGALLFLLGTGLSEESAMLLVTALFLLS